MDIKIAIIGASGKMGQAILALLTKEPVPPQECDVLIDVSSPLALEKNLTYNKPIVIGTTGHLDMSAIEQAALTLPVFYAPNFSLGVALLKKMVKELRTAFPADIDIIETHHKEKKDAPSGTAKLLAQELPSAHIHSIRSGAIVGEHTVIFNTYEESLTLTHTAHNRAAFARGALQAAHFLFNKPTGLYTMDNLFTEKL